MAKSRKILRPRKTKTKQLPPGTVTKESSCAVCASLILSLSLARHGRELTSLFSQAVCARSSAAEVRLHPLLPFVLPR